MRGVRVLVVGLLCVFAASPALAHAYLVSSDPADRTVLPASPQSVTLTFNEPVQPTNLQFVRSDGTVIRSDAARPLSEEVHWDLPAPLDNGGWLLSYNVISIDSHPVSGSVRIAIGDGAVTFADATATADTVTQYPRFLMIFGALLGAGLLIAGALLRSRLRATTALLVLAIIASAAGGVWFVVATANAAGGGSAAVNAAVKILGPGALLLTLSLAIGLALALRGYAVVAAILGLVALVGLGLGGHTAGAPPSWLSRPTHAIHAAAAALWLGSLILLLWRRETNTGNIEIVRQPNARLARFSRYAPVMIGALVLAGLAMVVIQAGSLTALVATRYGVLLAIKVVLGAVLLALAALNRWRLTRPALAGHSATERRLRWSIVVELILFVAIIAMTALLSTTVPPRSYSPNQIACLTADPVVVSGTDIGLTVELTMTPACSGANDISVAMSWGEDQPLTVQEVMLRFSLPDLNVEPFDVYLGKTGDSTFATPDFDLPLSGEWRIESRILLDEYTLRRVVFRVPLKPA